MIRFLKKLKDKFWDISLIILGILIIGILYIFDIVNFSVFLPTMIALFTSLIISIIKAKSNRDQLFLFSMIINYINDSNIDNLFSVLMGSKINLKEKDPIEYFFNYLIDICNGKDAEKRRRLSEALPALIRIDSEKSEKLIEILRLDWDDNFKSDIRRRAIESLPEMLKSNRKFVKENISRIDAKDEIFSLIAIVEVIACWWKSNKLVANIIFKNFIRQVAFLQNDNQYLFRNNIDINPKELLIEEYKLLKQLNSKHKHRKTVKEINLDFIKSKNLYMQICISRNILLLCDYYPKCESSCVCKGSPNTILKNIVYFLQENNHKYLRYTAAKEKILKCLSTTLTRNEYNSEAKQVIWSLIKNKEILIRRPAFDMITKIIEIDKFFAQEIIDYILSERLDSSLYDRACKIKFT